MKIPLSSLPSKMKVLILYLDCDILIIKYLHNSIYKVWVHVQCRYYLTLSARYTPTVAPNLKLSKSYRRIPTQVLLNLSSV